MTGFTSVLQPWWPVALFSVWVQSGTVSKGNKWIYQIFVLLSNSHGGQWHCSVYGYSLVLYQEEINEFIKYLYYCQTAMVASGIVQCTGTVWYCIKRKYMNLSNICTTVKQPW